MSKGDVVELAGRDTIIELLTAFYGFPAQL